MHRIITPLALCLPLFTAACNLPRQPGPVQPLQIPERQGLPDTAPRQFLLLIFIILAVGPLGACAIFRGDGSWAEKLSEREAASASETIVALLAGRIPPGGRAIHLGKPAVTSAEDRLRNQLLFRLNQQGYVIADPDTPGDAHRLRYLLTAFDNGFVLRVTIDDVEASTVLAPGAGGMLVATAPLAVREDRP